MATIHDRSPGAATGPGELDHQVELAINGMTCASCAARIEKKLNRLEGVNASVNFATEKARVSYADGVTPGELVATVARTGYTAELAQDTGIDAGADGAEFRVGERNILGEVVLSWGSVPCGRGPGSDADPRRSVPLNPPSTPAG